MTKKNTVEQPVSNMQLDQLKIEWVDRREIKPNKYNPNKMTWHDRQLLKQSLLEDGWTQPIVTLLDGTIVDGEQRWTVAGLPLSAADMQEVLDKMYARKAQGVPVSESIIRRLQEGKERLVAAIEEGQSPSIAAITGNLVPITRVDFGDDAHKMISTIRHNRARGTHQIDAMAGITKDLVQLGLDLDDLESRLGMDDEEISRFLKSAEGQVSALEDELKNMSYSEAMRPVHLSELPLDAQIEYDRSAKAGSAIKDRQLEIARRKREVDMLKQKEILRQEAEGRSLTQDEKDKIELEAEKEIPQVTELAPVKLKKIVLFVLPEEYALITEVLGEKMAVKLVELCENELERINNSG